MNKNGRGVRIVIFDMIIDFSKNWSAGDLNINIWRDMDINSAKNTGAVDNNILLNIGCVDIHINSAENTINGSTCKIFIITGDFLCAKYNIVFWWVSMIGDKGFFQMSFVKKIHA